MFTLEALAVIALLAAIVAGILLWKVSKGPVSVGWAKDYVQEALSSESDGRKVTFDDMVFSWPELQGPFRLNLSGLRVQIGKGEANTLTIDKASVGLSRGALLFGVVRPVSVILQSPSLELVRTPEGKLSLFFDKSAAPEAPKERDPAAPGAGEEVAQMFRDMAQHKRGRFVSRLDEFAIENASVAVRDYKFGLSWYLTGFNFLMKEHPQGVSASIVAPLPGGRSESAEIAMDLVYRTKTDDFRGMGYIRDINPYILSRFLPVPDILSGQDLYFTGDIGAAFDNNLIPTYLKLKGAIPEGQISLPAEFDAPIALKNIQLETEFSDTNDKLSIKTFSGEIGGIAFQGGGEASMTDDSISLPIQMNVAHAELAQIPPMFPKSERDGQAYKWLAHNIQGGSFSIVKLDMQIDAQRTRDPELQRDQWNVDLPVFKLGWDFTGASVEYHDTLMKAEEASGSGMLDLAAEVLDITGGKAKIGAMQGENVNVKVTELMTKGAGHVTVTADLKGPMATALQYIAAEPIGMDQERIGLDAANVKGNIEAALRVSLPTTKDVPKELVEVDVKGTMKDLVIPGIVKGLTLSGGPLNVATEDGGFRVKGSAQLADRDVSLEWHQYFESAGHPYSMQIKAKAGADRELRHHFGVDLDQYISGTMPVDVTYTGMGGGDASVEVSGDLNPMRVYIDPFKFEKPVGTPGTVKATAHLKKDTLKEITGIEIKSRDFSVSGARLGFAPRNGKTAELDSGSLPDAVIGKTKAKIGFNTKGGALDIKVDASVFDFEPFLSGTEASDMYTASPEQEKSQPMNISLTTPTMLLKNGQKGTQAKAFVALDEDGDITQLEYDVRLDKSRLSARFKPDTRGVRIFRLDTNDAGAALHAFGIYENVRGGTLIIYGEPKEGDARGNLHGSMRMENFRVVKAPALARLLSLMSLSGVGQVLGSEGLAFTKLESGFEWRFRPEGNLLIIKDGTTSGSSIGLTFSGVMDRGKKTTDIAGTIIPITSVNQLLGKIPLIGDILGGASGLIAATYSMKGPTSDPKVSVNPLSVLAPGIIRRILFEGGYESKIPDDPEKPAPAPQKKDAAPVPSTNASPKPQNKLNSNPAPKTGRTAAAGSKTN